MENMQLNKDGSWTEAIPHPLYGIKNKCGCGKSFWKLKNYQAHYRKVHSAQPPEGEKQ